MTDDELLALESLPRDQSELAAYVGGLSMGAEALMYRALLKHDTALRAAA